MVQRRRARRGEPAEHFHRVMAEGDRSAGHDGWLWPFAVNGPAGYGVMFFPETRRQEYVHRVAFYVEHGRWPEVGRHECDTPGCFNPTHILDGTHQDNSDDKVSQGRHAFGTRNGQAKLTEELAREVRSMIVADTPAAAIAARLGVTLSTVGRVRRGENWRHVDDGLIAAAAGRPQRLCRGEAVNTVRLAEADVRAIRARLAAGDGARSIAEDYGVARSSVNRIKLGKSWRHVE